MDPSLKMLDIVIQGNDESFLPFRSMKLYGKTGRVLSFFQQLQALLYSMQLNWDDHPKVFFVHSRPLTSKYENLLKKYSVETIYRPCENTGNISDTCNAQRLDLLSYGGFGNTHSLYLNLDILCLKPPVFDFSKDAQLMYAGTSYDAIWGALYNLCGINLENYNLQQNAYIAYNRTGDTNLFPFFNNGVVFINNEFAKTIVNDISMFTDILKNADRANHAPQIATSIAVIKNTNNWGILPKGCNFIPGLFRNSTKWRNRISLYHYCGSRGTLETNTYQQYFDWNTPS